MSDVKKHLTPTTAQPVPSPEKHQARGHGVCRHCGNEADMWVDLES